MSINRSGYYKWKQRKNKGNQYQTFREILYPYICTIHNQHKAYGYHSIASVLRQQTELIFSDNLIHKICKYYNIHLINGKWKTSKPMEIVVSDMTVLRYKGKSVEWTYIY
jgi:hypothetical protein